jgi:hypothetical protein
MDSNAFDLLVDRLERIEKQNDDQLALLHDHLAKDAVYYGKVDRHDSWLKAGGAVLLASMSYVLTKLGWR